MPEDKKEHNIFLYILLALVFIAIISSFYFFYFKKDFDFIVEIRCNPNTEICFYRDCESNPNNCPPNNLSYYSVYTIKSNDYNFCTNEDCTEACNSSVIKCIKTECTQSDISEGLCVVPLNPNNKEY